MPAQRRPRSSKSILAAVAAFVLLVPVAPLRAVTTQPESDELIPATLDFFDADAEKAEGGWEPLLTQDMTDTKGVVLLVHGLDEPGSCWDQLAPALAQSGYISIRIEYPNDQPIADSAENLDWALQTLGEHGIDRVWIVAHSMGGLVSMDAISRPGMDRSDWPEISRLITLGTPALGSALAMFQPIAELREQAMRALDDGAIKMDDLKRFEQDGRGQAGTDLSPGSDFLNDLHSRAVPEDVPITAIVGRVSTIRRDQVRDQILSALPDSISDDAGAVALADDFGKWASGLLQRTAKVVGDGVVSQTSATNPWTEDVVLVEASHRSMMTDIPCPIRGDNPPPAIEIVLDRLESDK